MSPARCGSSQGRRKSQRRGRTDLSLHGRRARCQPFRAAGPSRRPPERRVLTRVRPAVRGQGRQQQESQQQRRRRVQGPGGPGTPRAPGASHARAARDSRAGRTEPARPGPAPALPRRRPSFPWALGLRLLPSHGDASHIQAAASLRTAPGSPAFGALVLTGHLRPWPGRRGAGAPGGATCSLVLPRRGGLREAASPAPGPGPHGAAVGARRGSHGAVAARRAARMGRTPPGGPPPRQLLLAEGARLRRAGAGGRGAHEGPSFPPPAPASAPRSPRPLARAGSGWAPAPGRTALLQLRAALH